MAFQQSNFKSSFDHALISSFILWADNTLTNELSAYSNGNSLFYKNTNTQLYGKNVYASPYIGIIADTSISGIVPFSGVYCDNNWINNGQSGINIDFNGGRIISDSLSPTTISGNFSIKDFPVEFAKDSEEKLLFETEYIHRSKIPINSTGLLEGQKPYPIIYIKYWAGEDVPWEMGGIDATHCGFSLIVLSDSQFKLVGIDGLFRGKAHTYFNYIKPENLPFNSLGCLKTGDYNYSNLISSQQPNNLIFIKKVNVSEFSERLNVAISRKLWASLIDFQVEIPQTHSFT